MMQEDPKIYLRPYGILSGEDAQGEIESGHALPLAGGPLGFSFLDIIQRHKDGHITSRPVRVSDLSSMMLLVGQEALRRLTQAREPMPGLEGGPPYLMGVVNITPDSFSDGGRYATAGDAIRAGEEMRAAGAALIDVGGESTRPGAAPLKGDEEGARVLDVVEALVPGGPVSIDTRKAAVFNAAHEKGVFLWNDVSALGFDSASLSALSHTQAHVVLMHAQGAPETMQDAPVYEHALLDVYDFLQSRIQACEAAGIPRSRIIVDPGIGFGKTVAHNLQVLHGVALFHALGCPVMLGASRKSFIGALDGQAPVGDRLAGSIAALLAGVARGVQFLRVHDVRQTRQALRVYQSVCAAHQIS